MRTLPSRTTRRTTPNHPKPPAPYAVDFDVSPPSWIPANIDDALQRQESMNSTALAIASSVPGVDPLDPAGVSADGHGLVFIAMHRVPSTGAIQRAAIVVYIHGVPTRVDLPTDVDAAPAQPDAVVIAPGR